MKSTIASLALSTFVAVLLVCLPGEGAPPPAPAAAKTVPLFTIQRTENTNELVYEARLAPGGLDTKDPIKVYWVMKAEDGHLEDLTEAEKQMAYGVRVEKSSPTE